MEGIQTSIREQKGFALPLGYSEDLENMTSIADLFGGYTPTLENIEQMLWTQTEPNQPQCPTEPSHHEVLPEGNGVLPESRIVPPGAQPILEISSTPDMRDVNELVVTAVAANWESLALELGVKDFVNKIASKDHSTDYVGACRDVLSRWLRGEQHTGERERTWSTLLTALGRAGFAELERSLRREHFTSQ